ncbi:MAG: MFS transporter [Lentimicrobiaceae bacterium]|jgi:NNP family nitrate/nitrite transporter-like MFS transporter|nr:MFS transporter [Lentimicrobiaceae bacterium]MCP4910127.1 MFS transporter [Bacteroidota bacterium]MBT3454820.1 MFS transporter [Lentimicrobiaceae bacterium]MBT3817819.1 MFS transporter [Lentimicrobiaceae bacterium]MBT4061152.1 MFS transporter [Lentimicrobiaceae bacterium]
MNKAPSLTDFKNPSITTLHLTWIAFFLTFVVWFNVAPILTELLEQFDWLTKQNVKSLILCNVALTIPARVVVGNLIDRYGPRKIFAGLMVIMLIPGLMFSFGNTLAQLTVSRLFLGMIGAGFVIGIKMTANWFTPKYIGRAEGFYAGWGNFGSAAAAAMVPFLAISIIGGENGWRWSLAITSIICALYGVFYFFAVEDHPEGVNVEEKKGKLEPMPITSYIDLAQYYFWQFPLFGAIGLVVYNIHKQTVDGQAMISWTVVYILWSVLFLIWLADVVKVTTHNLPKLKTGYPEKEKYHFASIGALNSTYFANFGAELAIVSMLPMFFYDVFSSLLNASGERIMTLQLAGLVAGSFALINLVARPLGGLISDKMGNRKRTMMMYMGGIVLGFFLMATIAKYGPVNAEGIITLVPQFNSMAWLGVSIAITMFASFFVQGAEGATFAMIPTIKRDLTGRIAGMAGAYGNVGAVSYLFLYTFVDDKTFLYVLSFGAFLSLIYTAFALDEPKGAFEDHL